MAATRRSPTLRAILWLIKELEAGTRYQKDFEAKADSAGISRTSLNRAKDILQIESRPTRRSGPWEWSRPFTKSGPKPLSFDGAGNLVESQVRARTSSSESIMAPVETLADMGISKPQSSAGRGGQLACAPGVSPHFFQPKGESLC
jgi:hypothetical protein